MNEFGNSYSTYFQILKTSKSQSDIDKIGKISDRLIITKQGKLYFDWSDHERIEISFATESYFTDETFEEINELITMDYKQVYEVTDAGNITITDAGNITITDPVINAIVFDKVGNMGVITSKDNPNTKCTIYVLTKNFTAAEINDLLAIRRYEYK